MDLLDQLRSNCAAIAAEARHVRIEASAVRDYAASLPLHQPPAGPDPETHLALGDHETLAAFWITLDAINFGSGWFPTLRKQGARSGYFTIATGVEERFERHGAWSPGELAEMSAGEIADALGQDPEHELMALFARSLRDLGRRVETFGGVIDAAGGSAVALVEQLAAWDCFADPFLKRAQIAAADLCRAGAATFGDLDRLTMFADNLVPHVLRLDGVLAFDPRLVETIDREELLEPGTPEEIEIRACALHAVELIVAARPGSTAADIDQLLWLRGQGPRYKARPRHRCRTTAY
jgi:hypothetical protein